MSAKLDSALAVPPPAGGAFAIFDSIHSRHVMPPIHPFAPSPARLARMKASPHWRGDRFMRYEPAEIICNEGF